MSQHQQSRRSCRQRTMNTIGSVASIIQFVGFFSLSRLVNAQIGTTICVCSPAVYEFSLNFNATCPSTALIGDGILTSDCGIESFQNLNVTDKVPISAGSIDIIELDADLVLLTQSSRFGTFNNGDKIRFASISNTPTMLNETVYPKALQISIVGNNVLGETLFFAGLIVYDTECGQYPLIEVGSSIGWITFTDFEDPSRQICPLAATKSPSTTTAPVPSASSPVIPTVPPVPITAPVPIASSNPIVPPVPIAAIPTNLPQRSSKSPAPIRSTKSPSPISRSTKSPVKTDPPETNPPYCLDGKEEKSKKMKKSMKKSEKGKGKGKGMGKRKGKGKGKGNVFDHYECSPAPSTVSFGKGKGGKGGKGDDDDQDGVKNTPYPVPVPVVIQAPMSSPSMDGSGDIGDDDSMDYPTVHIPSSSSSSGDGRSADKDDSSNNDDDDSTSASTNQMYSNSGLSYPSKQQNGGSTISVGQKLGYSILLLVSCTLGIASGLIVYRQQRRTEQQQGWTKQVNKNFSWIRWGMNHDENDDSNDNDKNHNVAMKNPIITVTSQRRKNNHRTIFVTSSSSSSSSSENTESEKLTSKFRNEI